MSALCQKRTFTRAIITGTSIKGPITAAKATPLLIPNIATATAIATQSCCWQLLNRVIYLKATSNAGNKWIIDQMYRCVSNYFDTNICLYASIPAEKLTAELNAIGKLTA